MSAVTYENAETMIEYPGSIARPGTGATLGAMIRMRQGKHPGCALHVRVVLCIVVM